MMNKEERIALYENLVKDLPADDYIGAYDLDEIGFFDAPASTKYHGNYAGGLFDHSFNVFKALESLTRRLELTWERESSPFIVGMYHDLCKCDQYLGNDADGFIFNPDQILDGHGSKSIIVATKFIGLTDEEIACIRWHMGAYETDTKLWNYYGRAIEKYHNVLYAHTADMIASKIVGV